MVIAKVSLRPNQLDWIASRFKVKGCAPAACFTKLLPT